VLHNLVICFNFLGLIDRFFFFLMSFFELLLHIIFHQLKRTFFLVKEDTRLTFVFIDFSKIYLKKVQFSENVCFL